ncbi:MAG: MBL fold metallo-hydrolase [Candidatus Saccharibacteria bacterium]
MLELEKNLWVVVPQAPPRYPYANCIYINDERPCVIDFGAGANAFNELPREQIQVGLISHFHFDHVHGDTLFPKINLYVGKEEAGTYTDLDTYMSFHGYNAWETLMGVSRESYGATVPLPDDVVVQPGFRNFQLAGTLTDGQVIDLGAREVKAIHLPGHTLGHYGFYFEKEDILFSGDIDLVPAGPWYSSNSADVGALIESVKRVKEMNPRILVPSHRRVFKEGIPEALDRFIQVVIDREAQVFELLNEPRTLDELAAYKLTFPNARNLYEQFWEKLTVRNHLRHLLQLGEIQEIEPGIYRRK